MEESPATDRSKPGDEVVAVHRPGSLASRSRVSLLSEVTDVDFPVDRRGYDRAAVDRYVEHVSRIVAELESSRSPDAAIEQALADVGEETSAILRRARAAAEEIAAEANTEAEERTARAEAEARQTREEADRYREQAKAQVEQILTEANREAEQRTARAARSAEETRAQADRYREEVNTRTEHIADERHQLIEQIRQLAERLHHAADEALEHAAHSAHQQNGTDSERPPPSAAA